MLGGFLVWQAVTWPDVAALGAGGPVTSAFIESHRRESGGATRNEWVSYDAISDSLKQAVLVAEDIGFFSHQGFASDEMRIALRQAVREGRRLRGASTISQQLAKNLWLSPSRNPWRKAKEVLLTIQLERRVSKHRILEMYLNVAQLGPDVFGAEAAARSYYGVPAASLSPKQAAELAASLPRPRSWNPRSESAAYRRRVETIRGRMERAQWILNELPRRGGPARPSTGD